jgi:hypothetical protein
VVADARDEGAHLRLGEGEGHRLGVEQVGALDLPVQAQSAIRFIADQFGGPGRVLARHRTTVTGLCAACSSARPVRWPCSIAAMALRAELRQKP